MARILSAATKIINLSMPVAGTEYSYTFPQGVLQYTLKSRSGKSFTLAFESGGSYITIPDDNTNTEFDVKTVLGFTIYVKGTQASDTLEILLWV
jgi:hypothetical protein